MNAELGDENLHLGWTVRVNGFDMSPFFTEVLGTRQGADNRALALSTAYHFVTTEVWEAVAQPCTIPQSATTTDGETC